ncbi:MAG TPA: glycosyltransferase [Bryobacteraceae bacterium]|jgi:glycosyltransferase involved in cell wall biosynthesis|nr:glycosyltransferase [Bryobacteraceae bacterium]
MSLYIDLSEFLAVPMKTGIQRISGELCRYLPSGSVIPVRLDGGRFLALPPALISVIGGYFREGGEAGVEEIRRLGGPSCGTPIKIRPEDTVIVPELFGEDRAKFFREMPKQELQRCRFIVYDLLPATHPEYFPPGMPLGTFGYFQVIRQASHCGFISDYTRDIYYGRLKRTSERGGVVLPLGSDALGERATEVIVNRPLNFTVLGTIEPRKNHHLILDAFEPLLREIKGLTLSFIGKMGWVETDLAVRVQALARDKSSGLRFHSAPGDNAIRGFIEQSRATIYVSGAEGYGLPPVESLWVGTPVIASKTIPSLEGIGSSGVHQVDPVTVLNLRRAVLAFLDNAYANQKTQETVHLNLPTWQTFTEEVLRWCLEK